MHEAFMTYKSSRFNRLLPIEVADRQMRSAGSLKLALDLLGPVFVQHQVHNAWGLSLLHNHWTVQDGELPIQDASRAESPREFETLPRTTVFEKTFWPSILAVSDDSACALQPLEFTCDVSASEANTELDYKPEFRKAVCDLLTRNHLSNTFGLAMLRDVSDPEFQLVEFNYEGRVSLLRETTAPEIEGKNLIQTAWRLCPDESSSRCTPSCFSQCIVPASGGGHQHAHPKAHQPEPGNPS